MRTGGGRFSQAQRNNGSGVKICSSTLEINVESHFQVESSFDILHRLKPQSPREIFSAIFLDLIKPRFTPVAKGGYDPVIINTFVDTQMRLHLIL